MRLLQQRYLIFAGNKKLYDDVYYLEQLIC